MEEGEVSGDREEKSKAVLVSITACFRHSPKNSCLGRFVHVCVQHVPTIIKPYRIIFRDERGEGIPINVFGTVESWWSASERLAARLRPRRSTQKFHYFSLGFAHAYSAEAASRRELR